MKLNPDMLKDARDQKGLTQDALARALKMSRATINKAEKGEDVAISSGHAILKYLGLAPEKATVLRVAEGDGDAA